MDNVFLNGGVIGTNMYFSTTERYQLGLVTPSYVGGQSFNQVGTTSSVNISFNLTGGSNSTPQTGDLVIVGFGTASNTQRNLNVLHYQGSYSGTSYTNVTRLYTNDSYDTNLYVGYGFMGAVPGTGITLEGGTLSTADGGGVTIQAWRNIDALTPLDTTIASVTQTNTGIPNPPSITTVTNNAIIIAIGASGHTNGTSNFSATQLSNFLTAYGSDTYDSTVGLGSYVKTTAGAFDPNAFSVSYTDNTTFSAAAVTLALRPGPDYKNYKNSGIWSLRAIYENRREGILAGGMVSEGSTLQFTSPDGTPFVSVEFASYGTPTGTYPTFTIGSCHSVNSQSVVESYVLGQTSVSISATNTVFGGDPCFGSIKYLAVVTKTRGY